ncbi:MAG TPA: biotin transporter BioY [Pyrinomonadaceae bacterium]|nr:biotin transporter BioY [Pyrinomonadaceae bacterium]
MHTYAKAETLTGAWLAPLDWVKSVALVVAFSLFVALSAQVVVPLPFTPVPITLQTFAVLLTGALLGSRLGAAALVLYLAEGAVGLPFFRGGNGGALYLAFSPTAGYLLAYPLAAFVTGRLAERGWDRKFLTAAAAIAVGSIIILFGGWLGLLRFYAAGQAFALGVAPFIIGDILKIALAAAVLPSGWALLRKKR